MGKFQENKCYMSVHLIIKTLAEEIWLSMLHFLLADSSNKASLFNFSLDIVVYREKSTRNFNKLFGRKLNDTIKSKTRSQINDNFNRTKFSSLILFFSCSCSDHVQTALFFLLRPHCHLCPSPGNSASKFI